ncbi:hypothetical protein [Thioclava kandeliae]|uniref:Sulfite exporter TauE/SafE family protein n=1 Tax=Thioclava kandeliae TaxID=3070818 RepID=A0ABV1SMG8_9RHOB
MQHRYLPHIKLAYQALKLPSLFAMMGILSGSASVGTQVLYATNAGTLIVSALFFVIFPAVLIAIPSISLGILFTRQMKLQKSKCKNVVWCFAAGAGFFLGMHCTGA